MRTDPEEKATASPAEQGGQVELHVGRVQQLLLESHQATLRAAARVREIQQRVQRSGHPDRAAEARAHAEHARQLSRQAGAELAEYQARIAAAKDGTGRAARGAG